MVAPTAGQVKTKAAKTKKAEDRVESKYSKYLSKMEALNREI